MIDKSSCATGWFKQTWPVPACRCMRSFTAASRHKSCCRTDAIAHDANCTARGSSIVQADHASFSDRFPADRARQLLLHQLQGTSRATYQIDPAPRKKTQCKFSYAWVFHAALSTLSRQAPNRTRKGSHIELRDEGSDGKVSKGRGQCDHN